ncbi:creatininase family protein [Halovulum dunhuangense]|uniref:Creatininase family protein n=1 Tax=Halovulum dunhuangense TaxID=1505036 RepID=A0A849L451_9RHOB|nr:creatininase family protein [Halovulum dunhuangense]NNU81115.1 creatininase family protein [Halovulum dunhuangense]
MRRHWAEYRTTEYETIDPAKTIAILPTAAIEQHGPHLPVGVDTMINEGMLRRLVQLAPEDLDFRILPVQAVGKSNEHLHAPGTITLPADVAMKAWIDIGLSVARAGVRKLVIVNSHGGNLDMIGIVARELRVQAGMLAVKCQWGAFGHPEGMYSAHELSYGIHGGDVETSLMLHFRPDLVDMGQARNFRSSAEDMGNFARLRPTGAAAYGWIASDLNGAGTVGDASVATAEKGAATCDHQIRGFIELLRDVESFDLDRLGNAS